MNAPSLLKRAAVYARKSTAEQDVDEDSKSNPRQIANATEFINQKGLDPGRATHLCRPRHFWRDLAPTGIPAHDAGR